MQHEFHPILAFRLVGDFETFDIFCLEQRQVEQVQKMFHILNAIQVPVDVEVTVLDDIWESFRILLHSRNLFRLLDRAGTVCDISTQPGVFLHR